MLKQDAQFEVLKQTLTTQNSDIVIISLGSAGNDVQQLCPSFAMDAASASTVSVINVDSKFKQPVEKDDRLSTKNLDVFKISYSIKDSAAENQDLIKILNEIIANPKRKLIVINHMSPDFQEWMVELIHSNQNQMGRNFEFIGSYFQDIPIIRYNSQLFIDKKNKLPEINAKVINLWSTWRNAFDPKLAPHQYNTMSTKELADLRKRVEPYGTLYRNLETTS